MSIIRKPHIKINDPGEIMAHEITSDNMDMEHIPEMMPSGILYLDNDGSILYLNQTAADIIGVTSEAAVGKNYSDLKIQTIQENGSPFPTGKTPIEVAQKTGKIITDAIIGVQFNQEEQIRWLLVTAMPVRTAEKKDNKQVYIELRDFTQRFHWTRQVKIQMELFHQFRKTLESLTMDSRSLEEIFQQVFNVLPGIYVYPEMTSARVIVEDEIYTSDGFTKSLLTKTAQFTLPHSKTGQVEFHYAIDEPSQLTLQEISADAVPLQALAEWMGLFSQIVEKMKRMEDLEEEALSAYDRMIEAWSAAMETREKKASGHINRITELALELAKEMGFKENELPNIRRGALLHDIGKLGIPDDIILKPGKLTEDEYQVVKKYPQYTEEWLSRIEVLQPAMEIPYYHNERWDGTGYPNGLKGEEIPLSARMFAVVNVWDALISDRPYRKAMTKEEALDLIVSDSGTHFDPDVVESFLRVLSHGDYIDTSYEIKIQAFGQERVWVQNRLVTSKDWQVNAASDLFFLLLEHPEGLTKEQVGLYMWQDASPDDLNVKFKNTLYRLRKAVGNQAILLGDQGYRFNRMLDYFYDVETFTTQLKKAEEAVDILEKVAHLNKAIQEYQGDYLASFEGLWAMAERERYRKMYLRALIQLGEYHYAEQELSSALQFCQQALMEDPLLEEVHRLAMKIHAMNGNRAEVIRQYQLCKKVLIENYSIPPSQQTHDLYQSLIKTEKYY